MSRYHVDWTSWCTDSHAAREAGQGTCPCDPRTLVTLNVIQALFEV